MACGRYWRRLTRGSSNSGWNSTQSCRGSRSMSSSRAGRRRRNQFCLVDYPVPIGPQTTVLSLAGCVRDKLAAGTLPLERPARLWIGPGRGHLCALCDKPIGPSQMEYEPEYRQGPVIRLHTVCHRLWGAERRPRVRARRAPRALLHRDPWTPRPNSAGVRLSMGPMRFRLFASDG
jgi:hypothetical protein